jgi:competence protein ComEA
LDLKQQGVNMNIVKFGIVALSLSLPVFASPVNINTATAEEISQALNGIGLKKAQAIIHYREQNGIFKKASDIVSVKGIGVSIYKDNSQDILVK